MKAIATQTLIFLILIATFITLSIPSLIKEIKINGTTTTIPWMSTTTITGTECNTEQDCIDSGKCDPGLECTCYQDKCYQGFVAGTTTTVLIGHENSVCGNGICEPCENECCNYPCIQTLEGQICPPPTCLGYCPRDCSDDIVKYCNQDSDCVTYCGYSSDNMGRGNCVNKKYVWNSGSGYTENTCCPCEYVGECNTCECISNRCVTEKTGVMAC